MLSMWYKNISQQQVMSLREEEKIQFAKEEILQCSKY